MIENINERKICYNILIKYEKESSFLNLLLKNELMSIPNEKKGFITEVVYGVVRYKRFLDYKISKYSKIKINKISKNVITILRIAFYQLYFMNDIPNHAIINESVKICEKHAFKSKGFVNAILRAGIIKTNEELPFDIKYSYPKELFDKIKNQYPNEYMDIMQSLNKKKPTVVRANNLKISNDEFYSYFNKYGIKKMGDFYTLNGKIPKQEYEDGLFSVQSISSQLAVRVLSPKREENILDCCSAPGGKSAYIGELMENTGNVVALEVHPHRCELVKNNVQRLGLNNITVATMDSTHIEEKYFDKFDRVLCDVPCSGWGTIGGKPDIKWQNINIDELINIQKSILNSAKNALKENAVLVYCTCTINKDENIHLIESFLKENSNFSLVPFDVDFCNIHYGENGYAQILPTEELTGFFIAKLIKKQR